MQRLDYVNIRQGTDSVRRFSNGNTLPLTALPHSLAAFAPQTSSERGSWFYHPSDRAFEGIRLTHQPSPWVGDFSYFCFMPQTDGVFETAESRWSGFDPTKAVLRPDYLDIYLLRYRTRMKLSPTNSGAMLKIDYEKDDATPRFAILPPHGFKADIEADETSGIISGYVTSKSHVPQQDDFRCWFVFKFDCGIYDAHYFGEKNKGVSVALKNKSVQISLATSYISVEQALLNLERETGGKTFENIVANANSEWENLLSRIDVEGDEERKKTFYSCLYRTLLYPTKFYEIDKNGNPIHINPETNEVKSGVMYVNNGFWDTFRTVYPLYSLIIPDKLEEILEGFLNFYDDTGYLPRWPSPSEFGCMPGTLIEAVFADAVIKGLLSKKNTERALEAILKNANVPSGDSRRGRKCVEAYKKLGFVPFDQCHESVNETLDCAYGDFCIAVVAGALGKHDIADEFLLRAKNYKNLFDADVGFMRAKDSMGNFRRTPFVPEAWGLDYTEGSAWQSSFAVLHDIEGLALLYGGADALCKHLDLLFVTPPYYECLGYGTEIHEMTEMAAVDFGQCAISNQPSFHLPYIFALMGQKEKTDFWVKEIADKGFSSANDGFPGDEDNGTTAAWYIFACLGFYPLCPGKSEYVISKPLFSKIILNGIPLCIDGSKTVVSHFELK